MIWDDFLEDLFQKHIYTINNNSPCDIVLCGSCHMATIGFMLNKLLNYQYNIHIIICWIFEEKRTQHFDMVSINNRIQDLVSKCIIFLYHQNVGDHSINATKLHSLTNPDCYKLIVPNYRLDYNTENYNNSLDILNSRISNSSFPEFKFIIENHKNIIFFNSPHHPTHYLLFLQSQSIANKILKTEDTISISNYFDINNRNYFKEFKYIILPNRIEITPEISKHTGIQTNAEYFEVNVL